MRFKFVHAADLHLDSPLAGVADTVPSDVPALAVFRKATLLALRNLVDLCLREKVDFLLLAGDLFDAKDRSVRARLALFDELGRLDSAGIRTYIVHGNHDPLLGTGSAMRLPPSVKVFGASWEEVTFERGGKPVCRIQGISYDRERVTEDLSSHFRRCGEEFTLGLLHANLTGTSAVSGHANYAPCSLADLAARGLDYWALGHVHTRATYELPDGGLVVYPGNPQGRHVNETGERGCMVVEVEGRRARTRFVPVAAVRWHRLEVAIDELESPEALAAACRERIERGRLEGPASAHAVRLILVGRGPLHAELRAPGALRGFEERLEERVNPGAGGILLESVRDETEPELDLRRLEEGGGLTGELARVLRTADPELMESLWGDEALQKVDASLKRYGVKSTQSKRAQLLRDGGLQALERLLEEVP